MPEPDPAALIASGGTMNVGTGGSSEEEHRVRNGSADPSPLRSERAGSTPARQSPPQAASDARTPERTPCPTHPDHWRYPDHTGALRCSACDGAACCSTRGESEPPCDWAAGECHCKQAESRGSGMTREANQPTEETPMNEPNSEAYERLLATRVDPDPCPVDGCNLTGPLPHDHDWTASGESRAAEYLS